MVALKTFLCEGRIRLSLLTREIYKLYIGSIGTPPFICTVCLVERFQITPRDPLSIHNECSHGRKKNQWFLLINIFSFCDLLRFLLGEFWTPFTPFFVIPQQVFPEVRMMYLFNCSVHHTSCKFCHQYSY